MFLLSSGACSRRSRSIRNLVCLGFLWRLWRKRPCWLSAAGFRQSPLPAWTRGRTGFVWRGAAPQLGRLLGLLWGGTWSRCRRADGRALCWSRFIAYGRRQILRWWRSSRQRCQAFGRVSTLSWEPQGSPILLSLSPGLSATHASWGTWPGRRCVLSLPVRF